MTCLKGRCFRLVLSCLLIWTFLILIIIAIRLSSDSSQWMPSKEPWKWGRSRLAVNGENTTTAHFGLVTSKTGSPYSINSVKIFGEKKINIVIWIQPPLNFRHLKYRFDDLPRSMKKKLCFDACQLTFSRNRSTVAAADAIVFYAFSHGFKKKDLPLRSNLDQIWVYHQDEPPIHYHPQPHLNGLFNWTMTYRKDSDIYLPYYRMLPLAEPLSPKQPLHFGNGSYNSSAWIRGKSKLAAAVISNCKAPSKRLPILRKLQSVGMPIDIYGKCGNKSMKGEYFDEPTFLEISRKYWFYFAIENSICLEYVTEKFWRTLGQGMVPIVMGRANYLEIAPPNSFIDLRDFPNPTDLKEYLDFLVENPEAYLKFFEWRRQYRVEHNADNYCELCSKLRQYKKRVLQDPAIYGSDSYQSKVQENLGGWWGNIPGRSDQPACITPEQFGLQNYLPNANISLDPTKYKYVYSSGIMKLVKVDG